MKKIPTVFDRDWDAPGRPVIDKVNPECQWVLDGEGEATRKIDGTCVMRDEDGRWWARREVKPGKTPPPFYLLVQTDGETGKTVGWEPIEQSSFAKFHAEALVEAGDYEFPPGTYELVGPKTNGNPEKFGAHALVKHSFVTRIGHDGSPRTFEDIEALVRGLAEDFGWEGLVYHHEDGRMAKVKAR